MLQGKNYFDPYPSTMTLVYINLTLLMSEHEQTTAHCTQKQNQLLP